MPISVPARLRPLTRREWWWAAAGVLVGVALLAACWLLVVLAMPQFPDIDGVGDFAGVTVHTARWDHGLDLTGKRVAIIGELSTLTLTSLTLPA